MTISVNNLLKFIEIFFLNFINQLYWKKTTVDTPTFFENVQRRQIHLSKKNDKTIITTTKILNSIVKTVNFLVHRRLFSPIIKMLIALKRIIRYTKVIYFSVAKKYSSNPARIVIGVKTHENIHIRFAVDSIS